MSVADTDDATLDQMLDLNYRSAFFMARAVLPHTFSRPLPPRRLAHVPKEPPGRRPQRGPQGKIARPA
jgi:NAD(P)-dependent dehydrogenase (short-subunit alcohol dehydrogenase family)